MAANEEDYLDGLLKSLSDKENAESELKDEEEEEIKEQVREAVEKLTKLIASMRIYMLTTRLKMMKSRPKKKRWKKS